MSVSVVLKNICDILGEGPHWDAKTKSLLFVDMLKGQIHRYNSITGQHARKQLDGHVSLTVPRSSGGHVIALDNKLCAFDWEKETLTKLHEVEQDVEGMQFNDGKCDASGRLWAGTTCWPVNLANYAGKHKGALYSLECDGSLRQHLTGIGLSNGLAWSRDNRTMFYIDSLPRTVYAFDFDMDQGKMSNQMKVIEFGEDTIATHGYPDGCCMDMEDKLWVACYRPGKVIRFDPETGKELQTVEFPTPKITSCCFGGPNYDELYVTCVNPDPPVEGDKYKLGGSLFKVTGLGVQGIPVQQYG